MPRDASRPRLGRGLASLIRDSSQSGPLGQYEPRQEPEAAPEPATTTGQRVGAQAVRSIRIDTIQMNPYQPRRNFDDQSLGGLAASVKSHGLLQPILVSRLDAPEGDGRYQLIAGERRLRAAQLAGAVEIPCIVRGSSQQQMLELALVENLHREDLNPIERAAGYRNLMDRFALTQQQVAERLGQPRGTIANHLRLLDLPDGVQTLVLGGELAFGHAKILAGLAGRPELQQKLAERCVREGLSVRQMEELVRIGAGQGGLEDGKEGRAPFSRPPYLVDLERQLAEALGTKVSVRPGRGRHSGRIVIEYYSLDDFDRVIGALGVHLDS